MPTVVSVMLSNSPFLDLYICVILCLSMPRVIEAIVLFYVFSIVTDCITGCVSPFVSHSVFWTIWSLTLIFAHVWVMTITGWGLKFRLCQCEIARSSEVLCVNKASIYVDGDAVSLTSIKGRSGQVKGQINFGQNVCASGILLFYWSLAYVVSLFCSC